MSNYKISISKKLDKIFFKLSKRDKIIFSILRRKIREILEDPYRFKPLTANMVGQRRVHIGKSYVLVYEILEQNKIVRLLDFNHHDVIYKYFCLIL